MNDDNNNWGIKEFKVDVDGLKTDHFDEGIDQSLQSADKSGAPKKNKQSLASKKKTKKDWLDDSAESAIK